MPAWASATSLVRRAKPERLSVLEPDSPRSSSTMHLLFGPAQLAGSVGQGVLAGGGFAVMLDLPWRGSKGPDRASDPGQAGVARDWEVPAAENNGRWVGGSQRGRHAARRAVLSPLLANIYPDALDQELERRGHRFWRYSDEEHALRRLGVHPRLLKTVRTGRGAWFMAATST